MRSVYAQVAMTVVAWGSACGAAAQGTLAPRIGLSQEAWDFGAVWQEARPTLDLIVRNDGDAELRLTDVRTTCGCTIAEPGQNALVPGEKTAIRVTYDTLGKQGKVESKVIINSNDPARPVAELDIRGFVKRAVITTPMGGLVIRTLNPQPGQTNSVRLENQMGSDEPMKLQLKTSSLRQVGVEIKEIAPGRVYEVIGRTNCELPRGPTRGILTFSTGLSREPLLTVHARVEVLARVTPVPAAFLVSKDMQKAFQRVVGLQYYGTGEFKVTGFECRHPDVRVNVGPPQPPGPLGALSPAPTSIVNATLTLPPVNRIPPEGIVITFTTSDPDCARVALLVTADKAAYELKMYGPPPGEAKPVP